MELIPTGLSFDASGPKTPLKTDILGHTWTLNVTYTLSRNEVQQASAGENMHLDMENVNTVSPIVCFTCEYVWHVVKDIRCPGEPKGYAPDGEPLHGTAFAKEVKKAVRRLEMERRRDLS